MRKVYMQNRHDPANNEWGDCLRACIASLFELDAEVVPHFGEGGPDGPEMWRRVNAWLERYNLRTWTTVFPGNVELQLVLDAMQSLNGDAYYLIGGAAASGGDHIVVAQGNKLAHDPGRMSAGIVGPGSDGFYHVVTFARDFS